MRTGEGKTLVATMPAYLNALTGRGVHIATANPYLAKRDAEWMGQIYKYLGMTVGLIQPQMPNNERVPNYGADVTYGTANEFGFDYLRDNMAMSLPECVQRDHHYAIVDEVDMILIDEARTPLIISGAAEESARWYRTFARVLPKLRRDQHYEVDEAKRTVAINESGVTRVEELLGIENLYDQVHTPLVHYMDAALRAKELYKRDRDYMVQNGEVLIVDEFTGRTLPGRRWSDGLHQAVEAKEGVRIQQESSTLATITIQNYFRMYEKLAGMTGTAKTQAAEFGNVYKLEVFEVPTNKEMIRDDASDVIYKTEDSKFKSLTDDIVERHENGQPVLVGTISIEKSERLASYLDRRGVPFRILNAKNAAVHESEAYIIAQAGRVGAVTVSTNMAGRGVDILLGGNPEYLSRQDMSARGWDNDAYLLDMLNPEEAQEYESSYEEIFEKKKTECDAEHEKVVDLGGLYVLGTERHESRRIDNQLRGRSGRQGDPGESRFYLSLEDDLMKHFATGMISTVMEKLKVPDDVPIEARMVTKAIERAQSQVESQNFEIRKNTLKYDDVMNSQREVVYRRRHELLEGADFSEQALEFVADVLESTVQAHASAEVLPEEWDWEGLEAAVSQLYPSELTKSFDKEAATFEEVLEKHLAEGFDHYHKREAEIGDERFRELERLVFLNVLDNKWREHLYEMDYLREGIGLRAYGQRDPLVEYQREALDMFETMQEGIKEEFVRYMFHIEVAAEREAPALRGVESQDGATALGAAEGDGSTSGDPARSEKIPRNAPCPCGSGRKYKKCHGANA
jgi:preprotein translocase subunit SecA